MSTERLIELDTQVQTMIQHIHDLESEAWAKFNPQIYEDEHANISVYPPLTWDDDRCLDLQEKIGDHVVDVHLDTGFLILVYVYMPEQQIEEARIERELAERELAEAQRKREEADKVLAQAAALGMLQPATAAAG